MKEISLSKNQKLKFSSTGVSPVLAQATENTCVIAIHYEKGMNQCSLSPYIYLIPKKYFPQGF
jgi:hypothetical protein